MLSVRIFRNMLWCLPAPFRHEYGPEMVRAFADELREARLSESRRAEAAIWLRSIFDLCVSAPKEHYHVMKQDVRQALRTLAAQPGFTAVAVLSLALGIGANVALFSLVDAILLRALPVRDPQELVMLTDPTARGSWNGMSSNERQLLTYEEFLQLRDQAKVFASLMAAQSAPDLLQVRVNGSEPEEIRARMVSAEYFATLGVAPLVGRTPNAGDGPKSPLAVISHDYWQRRFGGRPEAIGASLSPRQASLTVIGVMPPTFFGETVGDRPDVWLPLDLQPLLMPGRDWLHDDPASLAKNMWLHVFGRLKPGVPLEQAQAAANVVFGQGLSAFYGSAPTEEAKRGFLNQRLRIRPAAIGASSIRASYGEPLTIMLAAAGLVLLIACANLSNLMLARATARTREIAVRLALGAGRSDIVRQMLTESMVIALGGGGVGLGAAWMLRAGLVALVADTIQLPSALEPGVAAFSVGLTLAAGLLLGLLPALRATKVNTNAGLREQGRGLTASAAWLRTGKLVVAGQVALSLPLLMGAALLVRTLENLRRVDLGFAKENLLIVRADVAKAGYAESTRQALFARLQERVRATPGVVSAASATHGVFLGGDSGDEVLVEGYVARGEDDRESAYEHVGPGFFSTLGVPLLRGRDINERDRASSPRVCVINEAFAKQFFAGRDPIGMHVTQIFGHQRNTHEVVGVVANSRKNRLRGDIEHRYYVPLTQPIDPASWVTLAVRTAGEPATMANAIRRAILAEDPNIPVAGPRPMKDLIEARTLPDRLLARVSLAFGAVALLLAAIGLYGVLSYGVARRTSEIGIRKALGAREAMVISMILRETSWLVAGGLAVGAALAFASLRWIESRLFGLAPGDPASVGAAVGLLGVVALVAAWLPARRASRVDPLTAIRYE